MSIFTINQELEDLVKSGLEYAEDNGGLLPDDFQKNLEIVESKLLNKIEQWGMWAKNEENMIEAFSKEIKNLQERKKQHENLLEFIKTMISNILNYKKYESEKVKISWRKSNLVEILDESLIPNEFKKEKVEIVINKKFLKSELKNRTVPGASLKERQNIQIK